MEAPQEFVDRLHRTFDGRLRVRWSARRNEFQIEQRVGRAITPALRIEDYEDDMVRARDGYLLIMSVRTGDRMPCPVCDYQLRVPVRETTDIRCGFCQLQGRTTRVVAGFFPLDDSLILHLQRLDPHRDKQKEIAAAADLHNQLLIQTRENDAMAPGYAYADESYRRLVGIPMVGYTGKEFKTAS